MTLKQEIKNCQKSYEDRYDQFLKSGYSYIAATEACAHYYLDGKPFTKGLTPLCRSMAFWNCGFWKNIPAAGFETKVVALALGRAIHFGISNIYVLERIIQTAPELLKRGIRYSQLFLHPQSPLWPIIQRISPNTSEDFKDFLRVCDRLREILQTHDKIIKKLQFQLAELTVFEFLLYESLFAFKELVQEPTNAMEKNVERYQFDQEILDVLNQLLVWKLKTRPEKDFQLTDWYIAKSLRQHLMPLIFPVEGSFNSCIHNLKVFSSLIQAMIDRNKFWSGSITSFSFDDDYCYRFDEDQLTIYPKQVPKESDWDRNGKKMRVLHQYWFNRALIEYAYSNLEIKPFGTSENDAWNRVAYIKASQVFLQLVEIFGIDSEFELPNGKRVDLFRAILSLEFLSAFFNASFIAPFKSYYKISGNWLKALGQLSMDGLLNGQNRFPLTWSETAQKANKIKSWTVSDTHPQGNLKEAEAILTFWSNDLIKLAKSLKKQPSMTVPEFHEQPILKLGCYSFQLPWLTAVQNNSTAAINNLRRIGSRRLGRKDETHHIEQRLGELFEKKGFTVVRSYQPEKINNENPGEIDLLCYLEGHLFILEIKSTYIRKTQQDAWIHYTNALRKAAQQLRRKKKAVLSALNNDEDLRRNLRIYDQKNSTIIHAWIVDTSIEYDQAIIDGFLKVSLEGLIVIIRNDQHLLRGVLMKNKNLNIIDLFPQGFSARRFAEIVETGDLWSFLDE